MLETDRLIICEIDKAGAQQFLDLAGDEEDMPTYLNALPKDSVKDAMQDMSAVLAFVHTLAATRNESDMKQYGVWNQAGEMVAHVGLTSWSTGIPELQITVAESQRRLGYATECLRSLIPWLFQNYNVKYIVYRLRKDNVPSEKIVRQLGGVHQEPKSKLEAMTITTYFIYPESE